MQFALDVHIFCNDFGSSFIKIKVYCCKESSSCINSTTKIYKVCPVHSISFVFVMQTGGLGSQVGATSKSAGCVNVLAIAIRARCSFLRFF